MYCDALAHPEPISRAARAASPEESGRVLGWDATIGSHRRSRGWPAMRSLQCLTASLIFAPACLVLPLIWSPRPSARRRRLPVARPAAFLMPPLTASALCAIFLAILTGAAFRDLFCGHRCAGRHIGDGNAGDTGTIVMTCAGLHCRSTVKHANAAMSTL